MAIRIEIDKALLTEALDALTSSRKRAKNTASKPQFKELYDQDIRALAAAANTITEVK